jgi:hypothetical protein
MQRPDKQWLRRRQGASVNKFCGESVNFELIAWAPWRNRELDIGMVLRDGCDHDADILHLPDYYH